MARRNRISGSAEKGRNTSRPNATYTQTPPLPKPVKSQPLAKAIFYGQVGRFSQALPTGTPTPQQEKAVAKRKENGNNIHADLFWAANAFVPRRATTIVYIGKPNAGNNCSARV